MKFDPLPGLPPPREEEGGGGVEPTPEVDGASPDALSRPRPATGAGQRERRGGMGREGGADVGAGVVGACGQAVEERIPYLFLRPTFNINQLLHL